MGFLPRRWRATLRGERRAPPKRTDREGNPEGRRYRSAHAKPKPDSESTHERARASWRRALQRPQLVGIRTEVPRPILALLPPLDGSGFKRGGRGLFPYPRSLLTLALLFVRQPGGLWRLCALVWWSAFHERHSFTRRRESRRQLVLLRHKLRRERPFVFAPQHGQRDRMTTSFTMSRRRKVEIELGT
jgi:hypothetical protein